MKKLLIGLAIVIPAIGLLIYYINSRQQTVTTKGANTTIVVDPKLPGREEFVMMWDSSTYEPVSDGTAMHIYYNAKALRYIRPGDSVFIETTDGTNATYSGNYPVFAVNPERSIIVIKKSTHGRPGKIILDKLWIPKA